MTEAGCSFDGLWQGPGTLRSPARWGHLGLAKTQPCRPEPMAKSSLRTSCLQSSGGLGEEARCAHSPRWQPTCSGLMLRSCVMVRSSSEARWQLRASWLHSLRLRQVLVQGLLQSGQAEG